jgi:lipoprotein-anchoring transpeptidase ErfK/SrfK
MRQRRAAVLLSSAVLVAGALGGCGADTERANAPRPGTDGAPAPTLSTRPPDGATTGTTGTTAPSPAPAPAPAAKKAAKLHGALAFEVRRRTELRTRPNGRMVATIHTKTEFKSPTYLAVTQRRPGWVLVRTAVAKHHLGWLPVAAGKLYEQPRSIVVDLSSHTLSVFHRNKRTDRYRVAIGTPATPTPRGTFAVTDRLRTKSPDGDYGCCILALTGRQSKIAQGWGGGDRIAIHATPHTWTIGKSISHGCIRASNAALRRLMNRIRLGTPVRIKA